MGLKKYVTRIQVYLEKFPKFIDFSTDVFRSLYLLDYLRKHENILIISTTCRHKWFKRVNDLIEQSNGHTVLYEKITQSMNKCLHRMALPEKQYMAEPSVQLADVNTQTVVPEIPVNLSVNSSVNLPDSGDPMSDSEPIQSASDTILYSFTCSNTCIQDPFSISYLESSNFASHLASSSIASNLWSFLSLFS